MEQALNQSILHLLHRAGQVADERFAKAIDPIDLTSRQLVVLGIPVPACPSEVGKGIGWCTPRTRCLRNRRAPTAVP